MRTARLAAHLPLCPPQWQHADTCPPHGSTLIRSVFFFAGSTPQFDICITDFEHCSSFDDELGDHPAQSAHDGFAAPEISTRWPPAADADIWSLGAVLHFMLAGSLPVTGTCLGSRHGWAHLPLSPSPTAAKP